MPDHHRAFYSVCNWLMEPWDGPAAIAATDGTWILAGMDRNGLRPMRYSVTADNLLVVGLETGMVPIAPEQIVENGRLGPGQLIGVDLAEGRLHHNREIKDMLAGAKPYAKWAADVTDATALVAGETAPRLFSRDELRRRQRDGGLFHGGARAGAPPHGRRRQGAHRLDGRRHAARRALRPVPRPAATTSARCSRR